MTMHPRAERIARISRVAGAARGIFLFRLGWPGTVVPLAWRNILADKRRLLRSTSGIAFAVLLMLLQLGFRGAFLDSALEVIHNIDGDIFLTSSTKFRFGRKDPFSRRQLYAARAVDGVASARPIYAEWTISLWKNPQTLKTYNAQVLAFDPDQPVFLFPEIRKHLFELRQSDTALFDQRARRFLGLADAGTVTELSRREIRIIGSFALGPDFTTDGTLITSDRTFLKFFAPHRLAEGELADMEFGVIKIRPGYKVEDVQRALKQVLPPGVAVLTKGELLALETAFQNSVSPVGPIFTLGTAIGFIVGMMISYQILYTDLSDQLPQYATLKAMGYENAYLVRVVLEQASFYALVGFLPAWLLAVCLYYLVGEIALLPLRMTIGIVAGTFVLTVGMCVLSGVLAVKRVLAADPAEVF
jgi:putative ABC transport system permease protein